MAWPAALLTAGLLALGVAWAFGFGLPGEPRTGAWLSALGWQRGSVATQPWRLLTAPLVHLSGGHLAGNLVGAVLLAWLGWRAGAGLRALAALALAWPLAGALLGLQPALERYAGLSGVLHAATCVLALALLRGPRRAVGAALLAGLLLKLGLEAPWTPGARHGLLGIETAPFAHLTGALAGALGWAAFRPAAGSAGGR